MNYEFIQAERKGRAGLIRLNRPKQLNALSPALMEELGSALAAFDGDEGIGAMVIVGSDKAFAAGADIAAMQGFSYMDAYLNDYIGKWEHFRKLRKPVIAAVSGYALGGGCELAMQCDLVIAADNAKFGQPEINLGVMPGFGGTQRLLRLAGRGVALELCLLGHNITAQRAFELGIVTRVVPAADLRAETDKLAAQLVASAPHALRGIIDAVVLGGDAAIDIGLDYESQGFAVCVSTEDMREGTKAFLEKRKATFVGK